jgi:hypothetical protein
MGVSISYKFIFPLEKYVISVRSIHSAGLFLILNAFRKEKIVLWYDSDGLAADERLQNSKKDISTFFIYFISRLIERRIVREAERILVRSCETKEILAARANLINADKIFIELENGIVIPELKVSSDYASFLREKLGLTDDFFVAVYLGSIGPQYCIEDVKDCVRTIKQLMDRVCFLVISNEDTGIAYKYFNGLEREGVRLRYLSGLNHGLVHDYLAGCDLGISFRADQMSMHHVKPLKNRNYLAAGIPLVYSVITGDKDKFPKDSCFPIVGDFKSSIASFSNWLIGSLEFRKELGRSSRRYAEQNCDIVNDAFLYFKLPTKK